MRKRMDPQNIHLLSIYMDKILHLYLSGLKGQEVICYTIRKANSFTKVKTLGES